MQDGWKSKLMSGSGLLIGSIALNLFLAGVVGGAVLRDPFFLFPEPERTQPAPFARPIGSAPMNRGGQGFNRPRDPGQMIERMTRGLEEADAQKLRTIFEETRKDAPARRDQMQQNMKKIAGILRQEKPDEAALQSVLDEIQKTGQSMHEGMAQSMKRIATEMSPESRVKIADAMERNAARLGSDSRSMNRMDLREKMMHRRQQMEVVPSGPLSEQSASPAKSQKEQ